MNYQAAIVGGGPAGLQAALTLGRMHVNTIIFDDARYRNARSSMMGNVLGWDGRDPAALRAASRSELEKYPWVAVVNERVQSARQAGDHFVLTTTASELSCERLLLACGVEDRLLPIPGVHELWGELVLPCPYCHGHEFAAGSVAVVSDGSHAEHVSSLLRKISTTVPVVAPAQVDRVERTPAGVRLLLHDGEPIDAGCVFIPPNPAPRSSLATDLGLQLTQNGVEVDELGRTSKFGVWAAGDVARRAHPQIPAAVVTAMAAGLTAAADIAAAAAHGKETPK